MSGWRPSPACGARRPWAGRSSRTTSTRWSSWTRRWIPHALLGLAHALEAAAGRVREVRWGPRTLDVDILAVDDERSDDPLLTLPHPRAHERGFVLAPWAEVDPEFVLTPANGPARTVADWAARVTDQQVEVLEGGSWWR